MDFMKNLEYVFRGSNLEAEEESTIEKITAIAGFDSGAVVMEILVFARKEGRVKIIF